MFRRCIRDQAISAASLGSAVTTLVFMISASLTTEALATGTPEFRGTFISSAVVRVRYWNYEEYAKMLPHLKTGQ
jgi:hypothetical protein